MCIYSTFNVLNIKQFYCVLSGFLRKGIRKSQVHERHFSTPYCLRSPCLEQMTDTVSELEDEKMCLVTTSSWAIPGHLGTNITDVLTLKVKCGFLLLLASVDSRTWCCRKANALSLPIWIGKINNLSDLTLIWPECVVFMIQIINYFLKYIKPKKCILNFILAYAHFAFWKE